jgi:hypothetical protein
LPYQQVNYPTFPFYIKAHFGGLFCFYSLWQQPKAGRLGNLVPEHRSEEKELAKCNGQPKKFSLVGDNSHQPAKGNLYLLKQKGR